MSAAVMSNYYFAPLGQGHVADSQVRVQNWMLAQMAQYPPPPQAEHTHYNALYPASAPAQQLLDPHDQLHYTDLNQPIYPKVESVASEHASSSQQMHHLARDLQHSAIEGQPLHHCSQHIHHQHPHGQSSGHSQPSQPTTGQATPNDSQKANRLRKACDSCSIRKVKCDESGPPCRACAALDIPCTFDRPSRRRGPPNRHAEAIKRRRLEEAAGSPALSSTPSPSSPTHAAHSLATLSLPLPTSNQNLSADTICSIETLDLLIDDFFTYIHPLCPFPHEPSFREAWQNREDLHNSSFLALLASMIGALVASFPRKPRLHLKAQKKERLFPNHMSLVNRCQSICSMARGPGYLERESLSVYDAATSYFLALAGVYTFRWRLGRLYFGECLTIIRTLGLHKATEQAYTPLGTLPASVGLYGTDREGSPSQNVDYITLEMGRRIFWTMFVGVRSMNQLGAAFGELVIPPSTPSEPYPPLPTEVDDFCIFLDHIDPQPAGLLPMITGFNANVKVYSSYNPLTTMEMAWGIDAVIDWDRQKRVLYESLRRCKDAISNLPPLLTVYPKADPFGPRATLASGLHAGFAQPHLHRDPAASLFDHTQRMEEEQSPELRRQMQHEVQKANIYASSLSTRSYIVEKYWNICEARDRASRSNPNSPGVGITAAGLDGLVPQAPTSNPDHVEHEMRQERESIVRDLLIVLGSIDEVNMEPNADSFTMKIRSIASTLLDMPNERKGQLAAEAQEYLSAFLKTLVRLERVSPANSDPDAPEDEETELRNWADLREHQMRFAQQGGMLGLS